MLNTLANSIDTNSVQSVNAVGNSFNDGLREVADLLFEKHIVCSNTVSFSPSSCVNNAEWFDIECEQSKLRYLEALRVLNWSHTVLNSQSCCECNAQYKTLIRKKKRRYVMMKLEQLEQLRHSKPRDFWKYF